jgi:DNA-binding LytR/AlgR family response regulator
MLTIALCDDEVILLSQLKSKIEHYLRTSNIELFIDTFTSGEQLLNQPKVFDIIFLDIKIKESNGIKIAEMLRKQGNKAEIVFISGYSKYVYDAFEVNAANYLLKPIEDHKLFSTIDRLLKQSSTPAYDFIIIKKGNSINKILLSNILYCEVISRKIYIHASMGIIDYYERLEEFEKCLNNNFFRCHRSYIVNLQYIAHYDRKSITLSNGENIILSKRKYDEFSKAYLYFLKRDGGM